jgi:hypothetical protein
MLYFKSCLRCKDGTVELGADNFGSFLTCISCGYTINSRSIRANGSIAAPSARDAGVVVVPGPKSEIVASADVDAVFDAEFDSDFEPDMAALEEKIETFDLDMDEVAAI